MSRFSFSSREFDTILREAERVIRRNHPDKWSDFSASSAGMVVLEVLAYVYAVQSWNIDIQANEAFIATAEQPHNMLRSADSHGYRPRGIVPATLLVDASLPEPLEGSEPAIIRKGTRVKSIQDLVWEVTEDTPIEPDETEPHITVATELETSPAGSKIRFLSGAASLEFTNVIARHPEGVLPGVWVRAREGIHTEWYRVLEVRNDRRMLVLDRPWHSSFRKPFIIRTRSNDSIESDIILASTPSGEFEARGEANLGETTITVDRELPNEVVPGHYFRFNDPECEYNEFFRITSIHSTRLSFTISEPYRSKTPDGFSTDPAIFEIERRGVPMVQGQTRTEEFVSDNSQNQILELTSENIVPSSIEVYDEDGCGHLDSTPWNQIVNLSEAGGELFRSYSIIPFANDRYSLEFGNGIFGKIPEGVIRVRYMVSRGQRGNVLPRSIAASVNAYQGSSSEKAFLENTVARGSGGSDSETVEEIRQNLPGFIAANQRAVTRQDYIDMVLVQYHQQDDVAGSVRAAYVNKIMSETLVGRNEIYISCWTVEGWRPSTSNQASEAPYERIAPIQSILQESLQEFLERFSMVTDQPWVVPGKVDRAVIEVDVKFDSQESRSEVHRRVERAINNLFLRDEVINRQPLLTSEVNQAIKAISGHRVTRTRKMYLDFQGPENPDMKIDTPNSLVGIYDLHPKSQDSIVAPYKIDVRIWNKDVGISIRVDFTSLFKTSAETTELAEGAIQKALHRFFYELHPGEGVKAETLETVLEDLLVHKIEELKPVRTAVESHDLTQSIYDPLILDFQTNGGGAGATAEVLIENGVITSITMDDVGNGYLGGGFGTFQVLVSGGGHSADTSGVDLLATVNNGQVVSVDVNDGGSGFFELSAVVIDGLLMSEGDRVLLYDMQNSGENGIYAARFLNTEDPQNAGFALERALDANNHLKLHPGVFVKVYEGSNIGKIYLYTEESHNADTFGAEPIVFVETVAPHQDAPQHLKAINDPSVSFRAGVGDSGDQEKTGEPGVMYFMENLEFIG